MTTSIPEENGTAQAMATGEQPKPIKKPRVAPRRASQGQVGPQGHQRQTGQTGAQGPPESRSRPRRQQNRPR